MKYMNTTAALLAVAATAGLAAIPARADKIEDLYKGKSIDLIVSAGSGGGYASYARTFAPFYEKHIPGKPNVVIKHMPGGGSNSSNNPFGLKGSGTSSETREFVNGEWITITDSFLNFPNLSYQDQWRNQVRDFLPGSIWRE